MKTVNGKSIEELQKLLAADFLEEDFKRLKEGIYYLPVEKYEQRLREVCGGPLRYSMIYSECALHNVLGKYTFSVNCKITIYADDGSVLVEKAANGGANLVILDSGTDTARPANMKSDIASAQSDAFKQVCNDLGIGIAQLRRLNERAFVKGKSKSKGQPQKEAVLDKSKGIFRANLLSKEPCAMIGEGRTERYCMPVLFEQEEFLFIVFRDELPLFFSSPVAEELLRRSGKLFTCYCVEQEFREQKQLHFRGWDELGTGRRNGMDSVFR